VMVSAEGKEGKQDDWVVKDCVIPEEGASSSSSSNIAFSLFNPSTKETRSNVTAVELAQESDGKGFFPKDKCVRAHGLQSEKGKLLNGCYGVVLDYDATADRYMVDFGTAKQRIKAGNLAL
jgi:hypothetical protein